MTFAEAHPLILEALNLWGPPIAAALISLARQETPPPSVTINISIANSFNGGPPAPVSKPAPAPDR